MALARIPNSALSQASAPTWQARAASVVRSGSTTRPGTLSVPQLGGIAGGAFANGGGAGLADGEGGTAGG